MNKQQAHELVRQTLAREFDKGRFLSLTGNILHSIDQAKAGQWNHQYVKDAFKEHVDRFERLGTFTSPEKEILDVLVVHVTKESKLERARTALRNFVADHLKQRDEKDAALVAFVSPAQKQWRFSYVKMEYATTEKEGGKVGVEARLTPARRFSYIVGEGESCHTAQTRFLALLQNTQTDPRLADIEEAFSVEAVTKEFYQEYRCLFEKIEKALSTLAGEDNRIKDEFEEKAVRTVDFAKKLMGQIVFLYFIQRKGWLGVAKDAEWGTRPRNFLRRLARGEYGLYANFFNDVLEPLFYDTLATDRGHEAWCGHFKCRIPFLNGGLFEPLGNYDWCKVNINLPDELFTNSEHIDEGVTGSGVLDLFDRYNFTVNEAEPLEKEVAIDPEMLGKVFENLIEENLRKGLGSYYTPREVVHYMCEESLINYLDTSVNKQNRLVPREDIETFVRLGEQISHYESVDATYPVKMPASIQKHARQLDESLANVTVCDPAVGSGAFPVGMMTEIVRERSSLTPYFNDVQERTPYRFKWHAIERCLYGVDIDPGAIEIARLRLWLSLVVDEEETKQIKPLPNLDFKIVCGNSLLGFPFKPHGLYEIEQLRAKFFNETDHGCKARLKAEIDRKLRDCLAPSRKTMGYEVNFDFTINFSEVLSAKGGFDSVIANPPYVNSRSMSRENPELRRIVQASYSLTKGSWDIYIAFFERGFKILNRSGVLSFITPDKWISKPFGDELRARTKEEIVSILKAGRDVFDSVNVDAIVSVYSQRGRPCLRVYEYAGKEIKLKRSIDKSTLKPPFAYDWLFSEHSELLARLDTHPGRLSDLCICENACATDDAYRLREYIEEAPAETTPEGYLKVINTGTIGKYFMKWGQREMVYLGARYVRPMVNRGRFLEAFPNSYGQKSVRRKIILKGLNLLDACLDSDGSVIPGIPTLLIASEDPATLKLLLALVNSAVAFFYIKQKYPSSSYNEGTTFAKEMLNGLPIPEIPPALRTKLISAVDCILGAKCQHPEADATAAQREIDQLIYHLYGLTPAETELIEESLPRRRPGPGNPARAV
jgi:hypothetical protein